MSAGVKLSGLCCKSCLGVRAKVFSQMSLDKTGENSRAGSSREHQVTRPVARSPSGRDQPRRHRRKSHSGQLARIGRDPLQYGAIGRSADGPTSRSASTDHWKGSWFMPLTRGKAVGYDADLMTFKFTMRNGQQIVQCQISIAALSDLADRRRGSTGDLQAEFKANRELIEAIASALFDQSPNVETRVISIFSKHIRRSRFGRLYSARRRPRRTVK